MSKELQDAISKLADLWPEDGELLASISPVEFINRVHNEIVVLRGLSTMKIKDDDDHCPLCGNLL